jgi:hypothetical protein
MRAAARFAFEEFLMGRFAIGLLESVPACGETVLGVGVRERQAGTWFGLLRRMWVGIWIP